MYARQTIAGALLLVLALPLLGQVKLETPAMVPEPPHRSAAMILVELEGRSLSQWTHDLKHEDPCIRERALAALPMFGPAAGSSEIVSLVIDRTRDRDASPKVRAILVLGMLDIKPTDVPRVVTALGQRVEDQQSQARYHAALALQRFGEESRGALDPLARMSEDPTTWEIRKACLTALAQAGRNAKAPPNPKAVAAMVKRTKDEAADVRLEAAMGLGILGHTTDTKLIPLVDQALKILANDRDKRVSIWAHVSQMAMDNKVNDSTVLAIARHLRAPDVPVRLHASRALAAMGPRAKVALDSVLDAIQDKDDSVALSAINTLVQMEEKSARVLAALSELGNRKEASPGPSLAARAAIDALKKGKK